MTRLEPASFEVERFELGRDACLEVYGRWFGVRGRRFMRPTLTAVAGGRPQRVLAVLDHKPWIAEEGEAWHAAFPWSSDPASLLDAELTVAPDVTVPLPPPSSSPARRRRPRAASVRSRAQDSETTGRADRPDPTTEPERDTDAGRLRDERDAALRSHEQALGELDAVRRDRERLRVELVEALGAHEALLAKQHEVIEAEVRLRISDLRAETERERAAAGTAAQIARERDTAHAERAEAIRERDEAHAERDAAQRDRNRMLAQRDSARGRVEEATRKWESTAALGTRRTRERDAAVSERDRMARERDAALEQRDRAARELQAGLEERSQLVRERNVATEDAARTAGERDAVVEEREEADREQTLVLAEPSVSQLDVELPTVDIPDVRAARRQPRPPRPPEPRRSEDQPGGGESSAPASSFGTAQAAEVWRARLLAIAGLLIAFVVILIALVAK